MCCWRFRWTGNNGHKKAQNTQNPDSFCPILCLFLAASILSSHVGESMKLRTSVSFAALIATALSLPVFTQSTSRLESFKKEAVADVEQMKDFSAQMVDQVFSYG